MEKDGCKPLSNSWLLNFYKFYAVAFLARNEYTVYIWFTLDPALMRSLNAVSYSTSTYKNPLLHQTNTSRHKETCRRRNG